MRRRQQQQAAPTSFFICDILDPDKFKGAGRGFESSLHWTLDSSSDKDETSKSKRRQNQKGVKITHLLKSHPQRSTSSRTSQGEPDGGRDVDGGVGGSGGRRQGGEASEGANRLHLRRTAGCVGKQVQDTPLPCCERLNLALALNLTETQVENLVPKPAHQMEEAEPRLRRQQSDIASRLGPSMTPVSAQALASLGYPSFHHHHHQSPLHQLRRGRPSRSIRRGPLAPATPPPPFFPPLSAIDAFRVLLESQRAGGGAGGFLLPPPPPPPPPPATHKQHSSSLSSCSRLKSDSATD
uniref:Uncharacterized protein n=1 Tax=Macrostomum lignano TaxID=282301 RepID=A0A1I8F4B6_9PLAT